MHELVQKTNAIIQQKKTRLCLSADLTRGTDILTLAKSLGDKICMIKTHVDILEDFSQQWTKELRRMADDMGFLIFEDRKFADIGNTVSLQFNKGMYRISEWADCINAHPIVGEGIIQGLSKANQRSGLILIAQMTSQDNLFTSEYAEKTKIFAKKYPEFVIGFIGSNDAPETMQLLVENKNDLLMITPGVKLTTKSDGLGQTYHTPQYARENGADIIIVGRGLYQSENPLKTAEEYRRASWE